MKSPVRSKIIESAAELFLQKGYHGVGINELIREAKVAKATFYNHFESKEELCLEWLNEMHDRSVVNHQRILDEKKASDKRIVDYFKELKIWMEDFDYCGCPYSNTAISFQGGSEAVFKAIQVHKLFIRDFLVALCQELYSDKRDAKQMGNKIFLLYSGAVTESRVLRDTWPVDSAIRILKDEFRKLE